MSEHTPPQGATTQPPGEILPAPDSSEQIFDGNVIRLRVSTYTRPSGLTVTREVLDHHGAVTMVPIEDDHILMVRQPREAAQEMMLELPAGKLDYAGEDPLEAAKRELGEEVGRDAGKWSYL
ncbi:MAG: NUDIX hydrolase, partial [Thermoleophilia bacterium]|nr:NUDIX hydrolase [Thermoleophilia bacterium]